MVFLTKLAVFRYFYGVLCCFRYEFHTIIAFSRLILSFFALKMVVGIDFSLLTYSYPTFRFHNHGRLSSFYDRGVSQDQLHQPHW